MSKEYYQKVTYIWHDLTVDPTDTPKDYNYYFVMTEKDIDRFNYDDYRDYSGVFMGSYWHCSILDNDHDYDVCLKSHGLESKLEDYDDDDDRAHEVVAWAEFVKEECERFVPKLFEKGVE